MYSVFSFLLFVSFVALIIGLIKPTLVVRWGEEKTRKKVIKVFGAATVLFLVLSIGTTPESTPVQKATIAQDQNSEKAKISAEADAKEEAESSKKLEEQNEKAEPAEPETAAFVNTAVSAELFTGDFEVGTDVEPGRYVITCGSGSGNLFVYNNGMPIINEVLAASASDSFGLGVTKVEVDLAKGQTIQISGLNSVKFEPATIELKTKLPSGFHLVGRDVPAGSYIATAPNGSGNFFVYGKSGMPKVNEVLGKDDFGLSVEKVKFSVKDGEIIQISGLEIVELN